MMVVVVGTIVVMTIFMMIMMIVMTVMTTFWHLVRCGNMFPKENHTSGFVD